jgi:RNA-dependent RNA polymerase
MMTDEHEANNRLSCAIRTGINYKELSDVGVCLTTEPYFRSLLCALYREKIYGLLSKARILLPVTEARLMMGVMDETGLLEYGQVFVQYTRMRGEGDENFVENNKTVVEGKVVVTRNPCLHPGDVRQLEAVDVPDLRHLVDCVVFPRKGARPHPNEMAGNNQIGFLYFVLLSKIRELKIKGV